MFVASEKHHFSYSCWITLFDILVRAHCCCKKCVGTCAGSVLAAGSLAAGSVPAAGSLLLLSHLASVARPHSSREFITPAHTFARDINVALSAHSRGPDGRAPATFRPSPRLKLPRRPAPAPTPCPGPRARPPKLFLILSIEPALYILSYILIIPPIRYNTSIFCWYYLPALPSAPKQKN